MTKPIFSKIDKQNFVSNPRSEGVVVDSTTITPSDKGVEQNLLTRTGGATLADFFVKLAQNGVHTFARLPRTQTQGRGLQLEKIVY